MENTLTNTAREAACCIAKEREALLRDAMATVCQDRTNQYGEPEDNFALIAKLWDAYLHRIARELRGSDVAIMMMLLKVARLTTGSTAGSGARDSWLDIAGYAACGAECRLRETRIND